MDLTKLCEKMANDALQEMIAKNIMPIEDVISECAIRIGGRGFRVIVEISRIEKTTPHPLAKPTQVPPVSPG